MSGGPYTRRHLALHVAMMLFGLITWLALLDWAMG